MSRLIVKNLPTTITQKRFQEVFAAHGIVTDVQLKYTKEGKFRKFGFVGFKTEDDAQRALKSLNETYIDTSKIDVQVCAALGDPLKPKAWSKYAPDSLVKNKKKVEVEKDPEPKPEKKKKNKKNEEIEKLLEQHKDDPLFSDFLEAHQVFPTKESKVDHKESWKNDLGAEDGEEKKTDGGSENDSGVEDTSKELDVNKIAKKFEKKKSEPKKKKELFTVKIKGLNGYHKKKDIKLFFHPLVPKSIRVSQKIRGFAYAGFKTETQMNKALKKDRCIYEGKKLYVRKYDKQNDGAVTEENDIENSKWKKQEEALKNEEPIAESGRIFVRNLAYVTTEDDLRNLFEKYGPLTEVNVPIDKNTRKSKGFGTITFMMPEHAITAYNELDGQSLNGRMLHILPAKAVVSESEKEGLSYKEKKELKKKGTANSSHNWNTLFLGQNAVADAIASTYNTTKEKVLEDGGKGTSVAVRLALGETQLVEETRKFLEENGVRLEAFNQPPDKRSTTIILVKNLPAMTTVQELREIFSKHGVIGRIVMPPSGITALVEYVEPSEARAAFKKLAYTKFKHLPLYLEWAPDNSLNPATKSIPVNKLSVDKTENNEQVEKSKPVEDDDEEEEVEPDTTIFVKNLNFSTTDDQLKEYFSKCGRIHYATVTTKKDPKNPGEKLSMGYGFVRYKYKADADRALKELQMTLLEGKTLELKRSQRTLETDVKTTRKVSKVTEATGTKILIRNIPFQANVNEITELFKAFGELKAVRLPKKMVGDGNHRGFGFVEYYTKSDAKKAFKALCQSTHLYGRRLALEWAQTDEDIDTIRKRTAKHFHPETSVKKSKKATVDPESLGLEAES
ncbi:GSCOCG00003399001-RA-CDS [Cotesia congregata]|uniref:Similar to Rbm19: Probable RNA-binding protein 19 (Mus musculus) n=1 Tax=Cotesia congregata TaxID=51543 RepID=A0A8J2MT94_COTCN|nr:GSCOCG00003399001-RA-CDS [Cotesia congregata]CAG5108554.1 Similar to Rbm19: Probable RNA-binding protein 19 (Mus musculus) [Cotesia congregata]